MNYATVESATESAFIKNLTQESVWIGINDIAQERVFKNVHNPQIVTSILNWAASEPNNDAGDEDCVTTGNGFYSDRNCENYARVLCEIHVLDETVVKKNLVEVEPPSDLFSFIGTSGSFFKNYFDLRTF